MTNRPNYIAMTRFGLGPSSHDLVAMGDDPRAWLLAQIHPEAARPALMADEPSGFSRLLQRFAAMEAKDPKGAARAHRRDFEASMQRRARAQITTPYPFAERLVLFWSNHFTVSRSRKLAGTAAAGFEAEAIRPHVFGRFEDMLLACVRHPAMLFYLDNDRSIGPNSPVGRRKTLGLNENLAREILELHTLGARGGYRQEDVTELAAALTGWSVARSAEEATTDPAKPKGFVFRRAQHEPGTRSFIGRDFAQKGEAQAEAILRTLARLPATARHVATSLARDMVADVPSETIIGELEAAFLRTQGDLAELARTLVTMDAAWEAPPTKVRRPYGLFLSVMRACPELRSERSRDPVTLPPRALFLPALEAMGQPLFRPPSPAGWSDAAEDWIGPAALTQRVRWIDAVVDALRLDTDPARLIDEWLAPVADPAFRELITQAPDRDDGLALLFASPQFQRC